MRSYFFLFTSLFLIKGQELLSASNQPATYYPAIGIPARLAQQLFNDDTKTLLNCPLLFSGSWSYPDGVASLLCNDAQTSCLRYALIIKKMQNATGKLLEELRETLALQKSEVTLRLRGCQLMLEASIIDKKNLQEATGYTTGVNLPDVYTR